MLLAIDAGNTNIVFAIYDGAEQIEQCRLETTGDLAAVMKDIALKYPGIKDVIISSVVPKLREGFEKFCEYVFKTEAVFVNHENAGVEITTERPQDIGADRLVNAAAVLAHYQTPAVIVDFGTATTFDVVDGEGRYCGGVIAPGINLSLEALSHAAAKLPALEIAKPEKVIGVNTKEAMQSGIYWGYIGLIEGTLTRITDEMGVKPYVIATGGLAPLFDTGTEMIDIIDPDLIMKGLVYIKGQLSNNKNRKSA